MSPILVQLLILILYLQPIQTERCDVASFYKSMELPVGAAALTSSGEFEDIDALFVRTKVDPGRYSVSITRRASNFYRLDGTGLHVKTRLCLELALLQDGTLLVQNIGGYSIGELVFND